MKKIILDILILSVVVATAMFVYKNYREQVMLFMFGEQPVTMYVRSTPLKVTIADDQLERTQGLSDVTQLGDFEGKLFVFSKEGYYGMWMKDMLIPLDIFWINNDLKIVHIEENVTPDTYPTSFRPTEPARFVLEVNAFFAESIKIQEGDSVSIPPQALPLDLVHILQ